MLTSADIMISEKVFFKQICRVCGNRRTNSNCVDLSAKNKTEYLDRVHKLLPIKVSCSDFLPKYVCNVCITLLDEFYDLWNRCAEVQNFLKMISANFKQLPIQNTSSSTEGAHISKSEKFSGDSHKIIKNSQEVKINSSSTHNVPDNYCRVVMNKSITETKNKIIKNDANVNHYLNFKKENNKLVKYQRKKLNLKSRKKFLQYKEVIRQRYKIAQNIKRYDSKSNDNFIEEVTKKDKETFVDIKCEIETNNVHDNCIENCEDKFNLDNFGIMTVNGKEGDTTLYLCKTCSAILISESAAKSHKCK